MATRELCAAGGHERQSDTSQPTVARTRSIWWQARLHGVGALPATSATPFPSNACRTTPRTTATQDRRGLRPAGQHRRRRSVYDINSHVCSSNYCHGTRWSPTTPASLRSACRVQHVDGSQTACGTGCHTNPPGAPHPDDPIAPMRSARHGHRDLRRGQTPPLHLGRCRTSRGWIVDFPPHDVRWPHAYRELRCESAQTLMTIAVRCCWWLAPRIRGGDGWPRRPCPMAASIALRERGADWDGRARRRLLGEASVSARPTCTRARASPNGMWQLQADFNFCEHRAVPRRAVKDCQENGTDS